MRCRQGSDDSHTKSDNDHYEALGQHQPHNIANRCSNCHAYTDFRYALSGQVGQYTVDSKTRQQQGRGGEHAE